jgi:hypothetical protein
MYSANPNKLLVKIPHTELRILIMDGQLELTLAAYNLRIQFTLLCYRQCTQSAVHYSRTESSASAAPHVSSDTGFQRHTFLSLVLELSPPHSHSDSWLAVHSLAPLKFSLHSPGVVLQLAILDLLTSADSLIRSNTWLWRMASSGMLYHVALVRIDVSVELSASTMRVTRIGKLGATLAVTSNRRTLRRNTKWEELFVLCVGCYLLLTLFLVKWFL